MKFRNKQILVYGLGDSGRAVLKVLREKKVFASFFDDDISQMSQIGFERDPLSKKWDMVIVSPGVKCRENKILQSLCEQKVPIVSELDFASFFCKSKIVGITGTNGKTTVSMLVSKILQEAGKKQVLCGNIGLPFSACLDKCDKDTIVVCEVSNFQLETTKHFRADVACILNVKPDHLDRHGSFEEYVRVKSILAKTAKKKVVLNLDDEVAKTLVFHKKCLFFSKNRQKKGVFVWKNQIFVGRKKVLSVSDISLKGEKNLENVLAAVAICSQFHVPVWAYERAIKSFVPASHRMAEIGNIDGVSFVDDSKATNVASTVACLLSYKGEKIFLLMGGQGKDICYDPVFDFKLEKVVCFGAEGKNIATCAKKHGCNFQVFEKFDDAVLFCIKNAPSGSVVLLSPACSSFDEFSSYAERGERFKDLVLRCKK